jgi:hypothetical protein
MIPTGYPSVNIVERFETSEYFVHPTSGSTVAGIVAREAVTDSKIVADTVNVLALWIGTNDLTESAGTGAAAYAAMKSYIEDRITAGWKVYVFTMTPSTYTGKGAGFEANRLVFNGLMRSDLALLTDVTVLDTDTISELDDSTDALYYYDLLHLTWLGGSLAAELFFDALTAKYTANCMKAEEVDTPINLTLAGTGAGVATLKMKVSKDVLITLDGNARFYSDSGGTADESLTYTVTPVGGEKTRYIKCTSGTANMVLSRNSVVNFGGLSSSVGWAASTNAPSLGGSIAQFVNALTLVINGNNTMSGAITGLTQLTILTVFGSNTLSGSVAGLTALTIFNVFGSNTITGDISGATGLKTLINESTVNTISGSLTNMPDIAYVKVVGTSSLSGSIEDKTALTYVWITGTNTVNGDIGVNNVVTGITVLIMNPCRFTYTAGATWSNATITLVNAAGAGFSQATQTSILIDINNSAGGSASKAITLSGQNLSMADTTQGGIWGDFDGETSPSALATAYKNLIRVKGNTISLVGIAVPGVSGDGTGFPAGFGDWYRS